MSVHDCDFTISQDCSLYLWKLHKLKIYPWKDTAKWQKYYDKKESGKGFSTNQATVVFESLQPESTVVTVTLHGVPSTLKATKWSKQNKTRVMTCYYQNHLGVRGYRLRLHAFWKEKEFFQVGVVSSANYLKERLAVTTTIRGDKKTCRKWWK